MNLFHVFFGDPLKQSKQTKQAEQVSRLLKDS
jgi:hypothetical protein